MRVEHYVFIVRLLYHPTVITRKLWNIIEDDIIAILKRFLCCSKANSLTRHL